MSVNRIIDEYGRWRAYDYTHEECMIALQTRDPNTALRHLGTEEEIDHAVRLLEEAGDTYPSLPHITHPKGIAR